MVKALLCSKAFVSKNWNLELQRRVLDIYIQQVAKMSLKTLPRSIFLPVSRCLGILKTDNFFLWDYSQLWRHISFSHLDRQSLSSSCEMVEFWNSFYIFLCWLKVRIVQSTHTSINGKKVSPYATKQERPDSGERVWSCTWINDRLRFCLCVLLSFQLTKDKLFGTSEK